MPLSNAEANDPLTPFLLAQKINSPPPDLASLNYYKDGYKRHNSNKKGFLGRSFFTPQLPREAHSTFVIKGHKE